MSRNPTINLNEQRENDPRRYGRLRCDEYLICYQGPTQFGKVVDLSASGMRIEKKSIKKIDQTDVPLELTLVYEHFRLTVKATVTWVKKTGLRTHQLGFKFIDLTNEQLKQLNELARIARQLLYLSDDSNDDA